MTQELKEQLSKKVTECQVRLVETETDIYSVDRIHILSTRVVFNLW